MADPQRDTHQKALTLNLDRSIYGTFAEIGAGQEVARWFLQAGGASGTVAKTISAYDMTVSDAIYGHAPRYVSRPRLEAMLDHEYSLLLERLAASKGSTTRFFTFADTISARNFAGTNECHGWIGLRFQTTCGGAANDVILHVNLLDPSNLLQQQAVGILGVNLVFAVYHHLATPEEFLAALYEDLAGRLEIDLLAVRGPDLAGLDERALTVELVQREYAEAVCLPVEGGPVPPSERIRKRPLVIAPGAFHQPSHERADMLAAAGQLLADELGPAARPPLPLYVLVRRSLGADEVASTGDLLGCADRLRALGSDVLVARAPEIHRIVRYLLRYTAEPVRVVLGVTAVADVLQQRHYRDLDGELFEALAHLFALNVRMFVVPVPVARLAQLDATPAGWFGPAGADGMLELEHLNVPPPTSHLVRYLVESGFLRSVPAPRSGGARTGATDGSPSTDDACW